MRVFLAGATGMIGGPLVASLRARGDTPVVLTRDAGRAGAKLGPGVELVETRCGPETRIGLKRCLEVVVDEFGKLSGIHVLLNLFFLLPVATPGEDDGDRKNSCGDFHGCGARSCLSR